jgi:hypothetical protein
MTLGYFCTSALFGFALGTFIFIRKRREWHKIADFEEADAL